MMKKFWNYKKAGLRCPLISKSAIISDNQLIFAITYDKHGFYESQIISLNLDNRKESVYFTIPHVIRSPGVLFEGKLYFTTFDGRLYCVSHHTHELLWSADLGSGNASWSIAIADEGVFAFNDGILFCIDYETGNNLWSCSVDFQTSAPCNMEIKNHFLYHGLNDGYFYCVDLHQRKIKWTFGSSGLYFKQCRWINEEVIAAGATNGFVYLLDPITGQLINQVDTQGPIYNEMVLAEGKLYVGNDADFLVQYEVSGTRLQESWRYKVSDKLSSPARVIKDSVWFATENCIIYGVDTLRGNELMIKKSNSIVREILPIGKGLLALSDKGHVDCYDL